MINKEIAYTKLVDKRKSYIFPEGLLNPSKVLNGIYDEDNQIGPWSKWQGNLEVDMMLIGQDWGTVNFFIETKGGPQDDSQTNRNLRKLFSIIDIDVGYPNNPNKYVPVFFTNVILGLKVGAMADSVKASWLRNDAETFLKPTINIIQPKMIITLGKKAYDALAIIYKLKKSPLKNLVENNPIKLPDGKLLFAVYHCGRLGIASRNFELQKKDWKKINEYYP